MTENKEFLELTKEVTITANEYDNLVKVLGFKLGSMPVGEQFDLIWQAYFLGKAKGLMQSKCANCDHACCRGE